MADFIFATACSDCRVRDAAAVNRIIDCYVLEPDLTVAVRDDPATGAQELIIYGYAWPAAWRIPEGVAPDAFDPSENDAIYETGADGFVQLLKELGPFLEDSFTVQATGSLKCRFPLSACEWHLERGSGEVQVSGFRHSHDERPDEPRVVPAVSAPPILAD
jgi:hypothetical protein